MFSKLQAKLCKRLRFVKVMVTTLNFNALRTQPHFRYHDILVRANSLPSNRESIAPPFLFYAMDFFSPIMRGCEDSRSWNQRSVRFKLRSFTPPLITCLPPISSLSRAWRRELHCLVPKALHVLSICAAAGAAVLWAIWSGSGLTIATSVSKTRNRHVIEFQRYFVSSKITFHTVAR